MLNRIICSIIGAALLASGLAVIVTLNQGMPSFDTFSLTISNLISVSYTNTLRIIQACIFLILVILRKYYRLELSELIVSLLSVVMVTFFIDIAMILIKPQVEDNYIWLISGFVLFTYGITLLVQADLLLAPNDKILVAISNKTSHTYAFYKVISDILMIIFSFVVITMNNYDIRITIFSIVLTFFTGVFVGMFTKMNQVVIMAVKKDRL